MFFKYAILFCVFLLFVDTNAFVKRSADNSTPAQNALSLEILKKNMDALKTCIDQNLGTAIGELHEQQLLPLFNVIGEHMTRFSRAFQELTAPKQTPVED